ncbi:MAG TPA: hypothetical protein VLJ59_12420 [Mycobacteriales bacterium]|nr:hypothetical protein [Mycobacteriales bacterium]
MVWIIGAGAAIGVAVYAWVRCPEGGYRAALRRRGTVEDQPRIQLAHAIRPGALTIWELHVIPVSRPAAGSAVHDLVCPVCAKTVTCTVRAAAAARTRRRLWFILAVVGLLGFGVLVWWGVVNFDPENGVLIVVTVFGSVIALVVSGGFADAWWAEDGVSLHGGPRLRPRYVGQHTLRFP